MTVQDYRKAVDCFTPDESMMGRIAARVEREAQARRSRPRRVLVRGLVVAAALVCLATAALAVSPELRQMVISLFRVEKVERVPEVSELPTQEPTASRGEVGELIQAVYVQTEGLNYGVGSGVFYRVEHDLEGEITQVCFWGVDDGALIPLEGRESAFDLTWEGVRYQDTFHWCVRDGRLTCVGRSDRDDRSWGVSNIPGRTDAVLLTLGQGSQLGYRSRVYLYHLDTGEIADLLAEVPQEILAQAVDYTWSEDLSRVILGCADREVQTNTLWYCDLEQGTQTRLGRNGGAQQELRAWFADGETLLTARQKETGADYEICLQNLETGAWTQADYDTRDLELLSEGRYALRRGTGGAVSVVDLLTGMETEVADFVWQEGGQFIPRGDRLLYVCGGGEGRPGAAQLGVLDLAAGSFLVFDRAGRESWDVVEWFDDNTAVVRTMDRENPALGIYLYTF